MMPPPPRSPLTDTRFPFTPLFRALRSPKATKPVVILKGGLSSHGRTAAASHTGALAGDDRAWRALAAQAPVALVTTVDAFIDVLLALQHLKLRPEKPTQRSEEHTSELQSLMRISYAVLCLKTKKINE